MWRYVFGLLVVAGAITAFADSFNPLSSASPFRFVQKNNNFQIASKSTRWPLLISAKGMRLDFVQPIDISLVKANLPSIPRGISTGPQYDHKDLLVFHGVYDKIDLVYYVNNGRLEYDFIVHPGGNPEQIRFRIDNAVSTIVQDKLWFKNDYGQALLHIPQVYQVKNGKRVDITAEFSLIDNSQYGFSLGNYDTSLQLVIDPILSWSRFIGGQGSDKAQAMVLDNEGNIFIAGDTSSFDFPTTADAFQTQLIAQQNKGGIFLTKLAPNGKDVVYSTVLSGSNLDLVKAMAVDNTDHVYLTGVTHSEDFPGVSQPGLFIIKMPTNGARFDFSRIIAPASAIPHDIAVNNAGEVVIVGSILSNTLPMIQPLDITRSSGNTYEGFVIKLNSDGKTLFSSYLGGSQNDTATAVALDKDGAVYVTGHTESEDFPIVNGLQQKHGGKQDIFITKLSPDSDRIVYSTFLGGKYTDESHDIAVDAAKNVYITGNSHFDFPLVNSIQQASRYKQIDVIVAQISPDGSELLFSSMFGGSKADFGRSIFIDQNSDILVAGETYSTNFPRLSPLQPAFGGDNDAFIVKINHQSKEFDYATILGGERRELVAKLAGNSHNELFISGFSESKDFPQLDGTGPTPLPGRKKTFISQITESNDNADLEVFFVDGDQVTLHGVEKRFNVLVANNGGNNATIIKVNLNIPSNAKLLRTKTPGFTCFEPGEELINCVANDLPAGEARTLGFVLSMPEQQNAKLHVHASAKEHDPRQQNNSDVLDVQKWRIAHNSINQDIKTPKAQAAPKPGLDDYFCWAVP